MLPPFLPPRPQSPTFAKQPCLSVVNFHEAYLNFHLSVLGDDKHRSLLFQFLPFSRGPRMCIGYRFATAEIKVALVKLLSNFHFTFVSEKDSKMLNSDISTISALTLKPFPRLSLKMEHARVKST